MTKEFVRAVEQALQPLADAASASGMAAYMKHHFTFLGVSTPVRRAACQPLMRAFDGNPLAAAQALWRKTERSTVRGMENSSRCHCRCWCAALNEKYGSGSMYIQA